MQTSTSPNEETLGAKCLRVAGICIVMTVIVLLTALAVDKVALADGEPAHSIGFLSYGAFMLTAPLLVSIVFVGIRQCLRLRSQSKSPQG